MFGLWHVLGALDDLGENSLTDSLDTTSCVGERHRDSDSGRVFAWTRLRSGSIVAPWLLHAVLNGATFTAGYLVASS